MTNLSTVLHKFYDEYVNNTSKKLKLIDAYLFYIVLTGVIQFLYCCLVGTFPFNSFLSGFISTVSCFVLGGKISNIIFSVFVKKVLHSREPIWLISFASFPFLQFAFVCKWTQKISCNLLEFHRNAVLLISFWLMSSYIWLYSISSVKSIIFQQILSTAWSLFGVTKHCFTFSYTNYRNVLNKSICMQ